MSIETTLYMKDSIRTKIEQASEHTGLGTSILIVKLMKMLMKDHDIMTRQWCSIKYQQKGATVKWRRKHISIRPVEYESFIDMRKFYKMSVSFLVAFAVDHYLDKLIEELTSAGNNNTDNYSLKSYTLTKEFIENSLFWTICWELTNKSGDKSL